MKTIIEMAHEAGVIVDANQSGFDSVEAFAALVRADERDRAMRENAYVLAEREACAKACEAESAIQKESAKFCKVNTIDQRDFDICAAAIRARGNT